MQVRNGRTSTPAISLKPKQRHILHTAHLPKLSPPREGSEARLAKLFCLRGGGPGAACLRRPPRTNEGRRTEALAAEGVGCEVVETGLVAVGGWWECGVAEGVVLGLAAWAAGSEGATEEVWADSAGGRSMDTSADMRTCLDGEREGVVCSALARGAVSRRGSSVYGRGGAGE